MLIFTAVKAQLKALLKLLQFWEIIKNFPKASTYTTLNQLHLNWSKDYYVPFSCKSVPITREQAKLMLFLQQLQLLYIGCKLTLSNV